MQAHPEAVGPEALPEAHRKLFERQQADNEELRARVRLLTESNRRLEHLIDELRRAIYDKRSEKRPLDDRQLAFEDLEGAVAEVEEAAVAAGGASASPGSRPRAPRRNLGHLPRELERIERVIEPESTECPCGCGEMIRIGEDRAERLDIVPAKLRVIVTVRPKYACRTCGQGVVQAAAPAHLVEGGLPTEATLAQVLISKYGDHLPLYRQAQILRPFGGGLGPFDAGRLGGQGVVSPAPGRGPARLAPEAVRAPVHGRDPGAGAGPGPGQDQDGVPVGAGPRPAALSRSGPARRGVLLRARPGRAPRRRFSRWIPGHPARGRLFRLQRGGGARQGGGPLVLLGARETQAVRDPRQPRLAGGRRRAQADRGHVRHREGDTGRARRGPAGRPPGTNRAADRGLPGCGCESSAPGSRPSRDWARSWPTSATIGTGCGCSWPTGAWRWTTTSWRTPFRPLAPDRKNALFAGHDEGAAAWARIASLVETAKMNGIDPHAYLKATLEAIAAGHPASDIDALMPWAYTPTSS